ncbi:MAG: terpene cyclase/mutase family protein [Kiritimatiellaeota bacterium]|nr:terpene cyclase/mutase family protein [Kiritimatiellota bacterium]
MKSNWTAIARRVKEHIWGPIGSAVFHVLVITLLLTAAFKPPPTPPPLQIPDVVVIPNETKTPPSAVPTKNEDMLLAMLKPELLDPKTPLPEKDPTEEDFNLGGKVLGNEGGGDSGSPGSKQLFSAGSGGEGPGLDFGDTFEGRHYISGFGRGAYSNRFGPGRKGALTIAGRWVGPITDSIYRALLWLKAAQNDDGSWGPNPKTPGDVARTGLALLAFLGYGQTTASADFGVTVEKGLDWLKGQQQATGHFNQNPYMHGIATYAICESFGMTRIPTLQEAMDKAVDVILQGQQKPGGGWDYNYAKGARRDTSVSAWQIQALKAAVIAGCTVPGLKEALELAAKDLKSVQDPASGRFGYEHRGNGSWAMTGAGVLCLQMLGSGRDNETLLGLKALQGYTPKWEEGGDWAHYGMYYITQAKFQESAAAFSAWNPVFVPLYCRNQNKDGSWSAMKKSNEEGQGAVYTTTLATLTLEVFVRVLPSYTGKVFTDNVKPATTNAGDVVVKLM